MLLAADLTAIVSSFPHSLYLDYTQCGYSKRGDRKRQGSIADSASDELCFIGHRCRSCSAV